jgi:hypothetical protein
MLYQRKVTSILRSSQFYVNYKLLCTGSALKGSARKQTTSLDSVLSNMIRHRKIEEMEQEKS